MLPTRREYRSLLAGGRIPGCVHGDGESWLGVYEQQQQQQQQQQHTHIHRVTVAGGSGRIPGGVHGDG